MAQPAVGRDITAGQSNRVAPRPDTSAATQNKIAHEIAAEHAPLKLGSVIKLQHVASGYSLPPALIVGSPAQDEQGMPDDEGTADVTFQVPFCSRMHQKLRVHACKVQEKAEHSSR